MALLDRAYRRPAVAWWRWPGLPVVLAGLVAGGLSLGWALWLARDAGDLAAQYAWTAFVRHHPGSAYNLSWYGGIHPASYSVLSPYVMAWLGVRTTAVLVGTGSAVLGALLITRSGISRPLLPALWLSVAVWCNIACGRITYMLGMVFALLAATLVLSVRGRPQPVAAAVLGTLATLCSPVAGLFIEVLAAALFLVNRRRDAYWLAPGPAVVVAATSLLFPFSGVQPFPWNSAVATVGAAVAVAVLTPRAWRTVRAGAWVYAVGAALCWALPTPIGSNVERLNLLTGAAILICAAAVDERGGRRAIVAYLVAAGLAVWTLVQPIAGIINTPGRTGDQALIAELHQLNAQQSRVEVVPLRTHSEAAAMAPYVNLARGWNRQADVVRNPLFYDGTLTATSYRSWLSDWSVGYVVLPATAPDSAGIVEAQIVTAGNSWLPLVWQDADWRVYRVQSSDPLASAPATATYAGPAALTVRVPRAGSALLRIAWSPWLAIDGVDEEHGPHACLAQNGSWTELFAPYAGTFTIEARYTLDRGSPCPTPHHALAPHRLRVAADEQDRGRIGQPRLPRGDRRPQHTTPSPGSRTGA